MKVNKDLLKAHALLHGESLRDLATALNIERSTLYKKISGHLRFFPKEINFIKDKYNLSEEVLNEIFKK